MLSTVSMKGRWFILFKGPLMTGSYTPAVSSYLLYSKVSIAMPCSRNGILGYHYHCVKAGPFFGRLLLAKATGPECTLIVLHNSCHL